MTSTRSLTKFSRAFNRQSVQGAIRALQTALKRFKTIPTNGIALFAGVQPIASSADGGVTPISSATSSSTSTERERLMVREIEPLKPLRTGMYYCDGQFFIELLLEQLSDETAFGYVILDGSGCHMYSVCGESYKLIWKHGDPSLPKKHGRGGQSAPRFGRLRDNARAVWVGIVAKQLNVAFTDKSTGNINVAGIILCGLGELKQQLYLRTNILDNRVQAAILPTLIDLQYGGQAGVQEAIKRAEPLVKDHVHATQKGVLTTFMGSLANGNGEVAFGPQDTVFALEEGAVNTLLLSESLSSQRVVYRNKFTQETALDYIEQGKPIPTSPPAFRHIATEAEPEPWSTPSAAPSAPTGGEGGDDWVIESVEPLLDHLFRSVSSLGISVQLISPSSALGSQFSGAFGGIGALLRYPVTLPSQEFPEDEDDDSNDFDFDFDF